MYLQTARGHWGGHYLEYIPYGHAEILNKGKLEQQGSKRSTSEEVCLIFKYGNNDAISPNFFFPPSGPFSQVNFRS